MRNLCKYIFICVAIILAGVTFPLIGDEKKIHDSTEDSASSKSTPVSKDVSDIVSNDAKVRVAAAVRLDAHRKKIVADLIAIIERVKPDSQTELTVENLKEPTPEVLVITLLGEFRAEEAVPKLLNIIDYQDPRTLVTVRLYTMAESFPAAAALVKIGLPSVKPLLDKLKAPDTSKKARELSVWVLKETLGIRLATARLEEEIEQMKDGDNDKKKNLHDALRMMSPETQPDNADKK